GEVQIFTVGDVVDIAAVQPIEGGRAHGQPVLDHRNVDHPLDVIRRVTVLGDGRPGAQGSEHLVQLRLLAYVFDRPAHAVAAVQGSLGALQDFDAVHVEEDGID